MSRPGCAAGNCLPGSESPWFLLALGVVWAVDAVLFGWWGVTVWRERRQTGGIRAAPGRATRRPRHAPTGRAIVSAVSVQEIAKRLDRERREKVVLAQRPSRWVAVIRRVAPSAEGGPDTAPFTPLGLSNEDR
ncbi:MAG: hypothetical protein ACRDSP_00780 [Pseudonocardiaceae bacterium]